MTKRLHGLEGRATRTRVTLLSMVGLSASVRYGAHLPHWTKEEGIYSVTFRLADSLPREKLEGIVAEREEIIRGASSAGRPLSSSELKRMESLSTVLEQYLDVGYGACWLQRSEIAEVVARALQHFDGERYQLFAWCVMPNHVHVVVQPLAGNALSSILHSWKSFTANEANKVLGRTGAFWQVEYYDHLIRGEGDLLQRVEYAWANPDSAGLKNWKWRWTMEYGHGV